MKVTVLHVGSSLLAPLKSAERDINRGYAVDLRLSAHNFGGAFDEDDWRKIESDLDDSEVVFVIHVMDGENAARLLPLLDRDQMKKGAVIVINCMPELMKRTRMGKLDFAKLPGAAGKGQRAKSKESPRDDSDAHGLLKSFASWVGRQARGNGKNGASRHSRADYLKWAERLPSLLRFVPNAGRLRDAKNYLLLVSYFLQPTPGNIRSMILLALKEYVDDGQLRAIEISPPESMPSIAIYHPDAPALFESFDGFKAWYIHQTSKNEVQSTKNRSRSLDPESTIGLLLMRPQIVSNSRKHYDALIRALEAEGFDVIPAISTLMDNREACERFFIGHGSPLPARGEGMGVGLSEPPSSPPTPLHKRRGEAENEDEDLLARGKGTGMGSDERASSPPTALGKRRRESKERLLTVGRSRVSQIVSLTGFSFVGGPAMNDSEAASEFLRELNIPYRSLVSLDTQTIESWHESFTGLNPVQTGMQIAIPEIDGATEPFVFGGIPARGVEPVPLADRCARIAKRLKRWHRLQTADRGELRLALIVYCFPPNKGNIGTAADLDVFVSLFDILAQLKRDGYHVTGPESVEALRGMLLHGNSEQFGATANVEYRMSVDEYRRLCPFVSEIEFEWGAAPGAINSSGRELLIQGITLGNIFLGVQPTFGYEGDPMRLLMSKGGAPHHGFAAFYSYLEKVFGADAAVHVGTHGALEFMPGKQVGLSSECWPDRLIGELPNIYIYSVNNPSEGTIAKRRSYAELISYLTPPIENAGLYKGLATLKDLIGSYREALSEEERERLYQAIEETRRDLNLVTG